MPDSTSSPPSPSSGGLLSSMRGLLATLIDIFQTRLELLSVELEEEKLHLLKVLALGAVALILGGLGILFAAAFVVILFWDEHRLLAVGGMATLFVVSFAVVLTRVKACLRSSAGFLAGTLAELAQDREALTAPRSHPNET